MVYFSHQAQKTNDLLASGIEKLRTSLRGLFFFDSVKLCNIFYNTRVCKISIRTTNRKMCAVNTVINHNFQTFCRRKIMVTSFKQNIRNAEDGENLLGPNYVHLSFFFIRHLSVSDVGSRIGIYCSVCTSSKQCRRIPKPSSTIPQL